MPVLRHSAFLCYNTVRIPAANSYYGQRPLKDIRTVTH